jgi:glycosyltransferase involved in cell wall biosynthesis
MTCFNEVKTARDSIESILGQLNNNYEVVVVDSFSKDGTYEVLREFEHSHRVKVIRKRCSRGVGRQVAFENASGEYILANLDLDDVFLPVLHKVVALYHEKTEGKLITIFNLPSGWVQNITIGPRTLIASLGGWRDLNIYEDWDIWSRAGKAHKYGWTSLRFTESEISHPEPRRAAKRLTQRYERYRDRLRLGQKIFGVGEEIGLSQRLAYVAARLTLLFRGVLVGQDPDFNPLDPHLFVDFAGGGKMAEKKDI